MKPREFIGVIKSGLAGVFALIGLFLISLIVFADSPTFFRWMDAFSRIAPSLWQGFAIIGGIGFSLGVVFRRTFPLVQEGNLPLVIAFLVMALPLGFFVWLFLKAPVHLENSPQALKLADCTAGVVNFHLCIPNGRDFQLELRTPAPAAVPNGKTGGTEAFSGDLRILNNGILEADLPISSGETQLTPDGYVVTAIGPQSATARSLAGFLQSGKGFDFELQLNPPPPTNAIVVLQWRGTPE